MLSRKLAVKRLTASDLTLFEWHFKNHNAGNQKAINLNADIFIDELFPGLPEIAAKTGGRVPLDLFLYGPGMGPAYNLQRKIVKFGAYKNWRLDGEFIFNPQGDPDRFNVLRPEDFAVLDFDGEGAPVSARAVFVAKATAEDAALHAALDKALGGRAMVAISAADLASVVDATGVVASHPVRQLVLDEAVEDAALGGAEGIKKLRQAGRKMSRADLMKAKEAADHCGQQGEAFVDNYLAGLKTAGTISTVEWVSADNVVAPYDFKTTVKGETTFVEVKSTTGEFSRPIHISLAELALMADDANTCHLYRVYQIAENNAKLRIAENVKPLAKQILATLAALPAGVAADGISVNPGLLACSPEIAVTITAEE